MFDVFDVFDVKFLYIHILGIYLYIVLIIMDHYTLFQYRL